LYIGGAFTTSGGTAVNRIAKWNGTTWAQVGNGFNNAVYDLAVYNNELYACGNFTQSTPTTVNYTAKWNGSAWVSLGLGLSGTANTMQVFQNELYVGGSFVSAGGITATRLAKWNNTIWSAVGNGVSNTVYNLNVYDLKLVVGGSFTNIAGIPVGRIAYWTGANWLPLNNGVDNGQVNYTYIMNNILYVGGTFTTAGGTTVNRIATWNGTVWGNLGTGTSGDINVISSYLGDLYVGGTFLTAGGVTVNRIAKWSGSAWSALALTGTNGPVYALDAYDGVLIAGGNFTVAGPSAVANVAKYGITPNVPILVDPVNGAIGIPLTPTLEWTDVNNASTYGVMLSNDPNFGSTLLNINGIVLSQFPLPFGILNSGSVYFWKANAKNSIGSSVYSPMWFFSTLVTGIGNTNVVPKEFKLYSNYPNPFNPSTKIKFDVPKNSAVNLTVYDQSGKEVAALINNDLIAGTYELTYNASNLSSGIYFCKITAGSFTDVMKMMLVK
jgi:hypothetical protein